MSEIKWSADGYDQSGNVVLSHPCGAQCIAREDKYVEVRDVLDREADISSLKQQLRMWSSFANITKSAIQNSASVRWRVDSE